MAKAAENYLKMHHPSLHRKMYGKGGKVKKMYQEGGEIKESYAGGGQVNKAQALQGMGDVVDAKLTPGEIVLNADQQSALEQELGQPIDGLMSKIGVPGFEEGGKVEKKYTPIGDPSKLTWNYHKMSDVQKDSLVTAQEKHYESLGHSKTGIIKAYDNIKTNTPEMNERDRTGGYEDFYADKRAKTVRRKKKHDALAKSGQRTRGDAGYRIVDGRVVEYKDGGKVEKRTVAEKRKTKALRTKNRKKKGK